MIYTQSLVLFIAASSFVTGFDAHFNVNVICYLAVLLLLSGDVELNPGPTIDDQPSCILFAKYLEPLHDWKPFALCLPGMTQSHVRIIDHNRKQDAKRAVHEMWIKANPTASWKDVINSLEQCKEMNLARAIEVRVKDSTGKFHSLDDKMEGKTGDHMTEISKATNLSVKGTNDSNNDAKTDHGTDSTVEENRSSHNNSNNDTASGANSTFTASTPVVSSSMSKPMIITSTTPGNPKDILRTHSDKLVHAISVNLWNVTDALYAKELIPQQTKEEMHVLGLADSIKAGKLVHVLEEQCESSLNSEQYLVDTCHVLINQQPHTLTDIATSILRDLGQPIPDNFSSPSPVDDILDTPVTLRSMLRIGTDIANNLMGESGEIPTRHGSTIKYNVKGYLDDGLQWKWMCILEDTSTGLKIEGPPKESRTGAMEHCHKAWLEKIEEKL